MKNSSFDIKPWYFVIFAILFLSILRGIRVPNIWSYSNFLFNYDLGFIKRGLIGEIISQFNNPYLLSYEFFFIFSIAILFIVIVLISLLLKDLINSHNPIFIGCSVVFSSSLAVVFLSHSVGYFDHIGLLVALITLKINGFYKKIFFLLPSISFALLTHEAILIIFFPVIFMSLLFSIETEGRAIKKTLILGLFSASALMLVFFTSNHTLEKSEAHQMYVGLQTNIQHPLSQGAFNVLHRDIKDNFYIMKNKWSNKKRLIKLALSFLVTAPVFIIFNYFTTVILKKSKVESNLIVLAILASLSPLVLHLFAWDMHRWNTLAMITSFLMLYITYTSKLKKQPIATSNSIYPVLVFIIFFNGASSITLFNKYNVKQFPFIEHNKYIFDVIYGKEIFPYVPSN